MPWRHYFRSSAAHNTVVIDDKDQSEYGGSFLWLQHAQTVVEAFRAAGAEQTLTAHHTGYQRLIDPVTHRRTWRYTDALSVTDELVCSATHSVAIYWHFAPECTVAIENNSVVARREGVRVVLECPNGLTPSLKDDVFSNGFDRKMPATTAVWGGEIAGTTQFRTELKISAA
jgi:hypothetical protein